MMSLALFAFLGLAAGNTPRNVGSVDAVYSLIDRTLPGSRAHFKLSISQSLTDDGEFSVTLADTSDEKVAIVGSSASELSYGVGFYFREICNMTIGWKRGGGSRIFMPRQWPTIGSKPITKTRLVPWSYMMNVCTHSYSLVWYSWRDWEEFIDWMAMSGINHFLAMTGQEEVQHKVFQQFGLDDASIRSWFNGPAFLTWSRGQNEYGSGIAGPLPRSFMREQWDLQKKIVARHRSLGMTGQLPAFQGNVPVQLKALQKDSNMTQQGDTGWMDALDPLYAKIADAWMQTLIADFGTDHWYQLDGYLNGGTAPWEVETTVGLEQTALPKSADCTWSNKQPGYIPSCTATGGCIPYSTESAAKAKCSIWAECGGITADKNETIWQVRGGSEILPSPSGEVSYVIENLNACHDWNLPIITNPAWFQRGVAVYTGLNRTDPHAIWSYQGWPVEHWLSRSRAGNLKGFIEAVPEGKFNVVDMAASGEWRKWNASAYWGANFVWTTLENFGGDDGMKGNLSLVNEIPFAAMAPEQNTSVWGTGFTSEGIDQNPVYYEFVLEANFRTERVSNITEHIIKRAHRRYGFVAEDPDVTRAWSLLAATVYSQDLGYRDSTAVGHLGSTDVWSWDSDRQAPTESLCKVHSAWGSLIDAGAEVTKPMTEPFRYDLVDTGREVLAQLAGPVGNNFTAAISRAVLNQQEVEAAGGLYAQVLMDVDTLVGTDPAFMLGPWLESARKLGGNATDCNGTIIGDLECGDFMEWNARCQLTSWHPTPKNATKIQTSDYATKHWSGLISDYYVERVKLIVGQALVDAEVGNPLNTTAVDAIKAKHAFAWTTATNEYPTTPANDALKVAAAMWHKYREHFLACYTQ